MEAGEQLRFVDRAVDIFRANNIDELDGTTSVEALHQRHFANAQGTRAIEPDGDADRCFTADRHHQSSARPCSGWLATIIIHIIRVAFAIPAGEAEVRWIMSCFDDRFFAREFVLMNAIKI
jgi:hypothetical protein